MEIIEFPSVLLRWNTQTNMVERIAEFQRYCKPRISPKLTDFCTQLTGITQETVDNGIAFEQAYKEHFAWLHDNIPDFYNNISNVIIMTVGQWDLKIMLPKELERRKIKPAEIYRWYVNVKSEFVYIINPKNRKGYGMTNMLKYLKLPLVGRHHSGIDDCRNTATIVEELIKRGMKYDNMQFMKV